MSGDEADFDEFYRSAARDVVHVVYAATGDLTLAQDSTQEAFARAWQRWDSVSTYDDPRAWVRTVARRLAVSSWRKRTNERKAHVRHGAPASAPQPSEDGVAVVAALRTLSPPVREAVALYYIADRSIDQIAAETHTPAGTVKARLHRGRAQLAAALSTEESRHD
ncbi:MAG TPA: sigma-70 family RNA polymerase sigma factor [Segeticoccus sp.]|uniref:RNA polymerase sigma factor n=1 Tax=Segeticoccus sp. TaxID=2706531 RepID=UPI002D7EE025|nr:sigma-70 family RNA polymerase sigma factor [Segeticoccus sp.]HET8598696.1 sigma-70 family RNA polymerase sigma factor [Segeticoccus sp.]